MYAFFERFVDLMFVILRGPFGPVLLVIFIAILLFIVRSPPQRV